MNRHSDQPHAGSAMLASMPRQRVRRRQMRVRRAALAHMQRQAALTALRVLLLPTRLSEALHGTTARAMSVTAGRMEVHARDAQPASTRMYQDQANAQTVRQGRIPWSTGRRANLLALLVDLAHTLPHLAAQHVDSARPLRAHLRAVIRQSCALATRVTQVRTEDHARAAQLASTRIRLAQASARNAMLGPTHWSKGRPCVLHARRFRSAQPAAAVACAMRDTLDRMSDLALLAELANTRARWDRPIVYPASPEATPQKKRGICHVKNARRVPTAERQGQQNARRVLPLLGVRAANPSAAATRDTLDRTVGRATLVLRGPTRARLAPLPASIAPPGRILPSLVPRRTQPAACAKRGSILGIPMHRGSTSRIASTAAWESSQQMKERPRWQFARVVVRASTMTKRVQLSAMTVHEENSPLR